MLEALISKASQGFNNVKLLDKLLKRKNPGAKNLVFVEAGRRGGLRSGELRRTRAEQRRLMEEGSSPTERARRKKELVYEMKRRGLI